MKRILRQDEGSELIEYVLLVALIAIGCIPALQRLSSAIAAAWDSISTRLAG
jgi:Flp pilus assembly pilin Flp